MKFTHIKKYGAILAGGFFLLTLALVPLAALAQGEEEPAKDIDVVGGIGCAVGWYVLPNGTGCALGAQAATVVADHAVDAGIATVLGPVAAISWAIFMISAQLLGIAGTVFNFAMQYLVFDFGQFFGNSTGMLLAWGVLRDIGNILLIFGFIFMGIATILDLHNYSARKSLPRLIIFAVLLNFSLFTAEAVIDASNVFASTLYQQGFTAAQEDCDRVEVAGTQGDVEGACAIESGVSGSILSAARMTTVFQEQDQGFLEGLASYMDEPLPYILKFIGLALITTTAAIVLLAGAFMLIGRGVQLALLMVTSPIGFAGMAIPPLQKFAQDWWHRLISQALFAPVFLLLLLVALKVVEGLATLSNASGGLANAFSTNSALDIGPVFFYILIMAFLIMALMSAKKFGVWGAEMATSGAKTLVMGAAVGLPMGMAARASNLVVGGSAAMLRKSMPNSALAHQILKPIEGVNLDIRRLPGLGALGAPAKGMATFNEVGGVYEGFADGKYKDARERKLKEYKKSQNDEKVHHANELKAKANEDRAKAIAKELRGTGVFPAGEQQFWAGLSATEVAQHKDGLLSAQGAQALTPDTFAQLMDKKNDSLTDVEKERLADERFTGLRAAIANAANNPTDANKQKLKDTVRGLQKGELEYVAPGTFAEDGFLGALSEKQREMLGESTKRTADERRAVKESSPQMRFEIAFKNAPTDADKANVVAQRYGDLGPEQIGKLDEAILQHQALASALKGAVLDKLQRDGKLSNKTIEEIGKHNTLAQAGTRAAYWT